MPASDLHRLYSARFNQWVRCRDAFEGTDAIKFKRTEYLPKLSSQKNPEYEAYLKRALWYGATGRTVHGLTGAIMRKPPSYSVPEAIEEHLEDVTRTGTPLGPFCSNLVKEVLMVGRCGVLLDLPSEGQNGSPRPHWVQYDAEQIINWRTVTINGAKLVTMVVLKEETEEPVDDFHGDLVTQYRVLRLVNGYYQVDLFRLSGKTLAQMDSVTPVIRGKKIPYVPFVFFNSQHLEADPDKPPLLDLVDVNLSHYLTSADLEHGRHFTALPTPYVTGLSKDTPLKIGSSTAWAIPVAEARVGMLEFTGQGLSALEKAQESKEKQMAVLGARMLEEQKLAAETSETLTIRRSGESSLLASVACTASTGLTRIVRWHAEWVGTSEANMTKIDLNKDFFGIPMSSSDLSALVQSWQSGAMSYETFYQNLERGELTRPGITAEEERLQIENETPTLDLGNFIPGNSSANGGGEYDSGNPNDQLTDEDEEGAAGGATKPRSRTAGPRARQAGSQA